MKTKIKLPLFPFELPPQPCVQSGQCCKTSICDFQFGEWDAAKKQCKFLERNEDDAKLGIETYRCGKYAEIVAFEQRIGARHPMFGPNSGGCCQPLFNRNRMEIIATKLARGHGLPRLIDLCPSE